MNTKLSCINDAVGAQLPHYELDMLSTDNRDHFEMHLVDCDFCREELQSFRTVVNVMHKDREQLREELKRKGMTFDALILQIAGEVEPRPLKGDTMSVGERFSSWLRLPWIWGPALGVACIALLLTITGPATESRYSGLVIFDPLPYSGLNIRGGDEATSSFQSGIELYEAGNYKAAVKTLKKATELNASHGPAWLYLGISYFLQEKPDEAIAALSKANEINKGDDFLHGQWYLSQAYLLDGSPAQAKPLLDQLARAGLAHSTQAAVLRDMIETLK